MAMLLILILHLLCWAAFTQAISAQSASTNTTVTGTWKTLTQVPAGPIHEHAVVALSSTQVSVIGGVLQTGVTDSVYIYDITKDTWKKVASLPIAINHANSAVVDGKIYVLGGMAGTGWVGTPRCWVYDPAVDKWTAIASMPAVEARGSAVTDVHGKTIWLVSGKTKSGGESVTTVSAFDTVLGRWLADIPATAKEIPEGRDHGGGGIVGNRFYQLGGSLGGIENRKDTVFVLDLENLGKGWFRAKGRMPTPRRGFATGIIGQKIYTFGGEGNPDPASRGVFKEVEMYDTSSDGWTSLPPMKVPRHGTAAVVLNGSIYIPGGGTASGTPATDVFDVFSP